MKSYYKSGCSKGLLDRVFGYFNHLRSDIRNALLIRKAFLNYKSLLIAVHRKSFPMRVYSKKHGYALVSNLDQLLLIAHSNVRKGVHYDISEDMLTIDLGNVDDYTERNKITLYGCGSNGDAISIFLEREYDFLPVKGKIVIDAGANIGDSSIYFCLRGAERVIGLEPFPATYEIAKKNITINNLSSKVDLLLAGLGAQMRHLTIDPNYVGSVSSRTVNFERGIAVPVLTLAALLNKFGLSSKDIVLKLDCEGCEYESIMNASTNLLRTFSHIQIEYHHGCNDLAKKLMDSGFKVFCERERRGVPYFNEGRVHYTGYVYAARENSQKD